MRTALIILALTLSGVALMSAFSDTNTPQEVAR